MNNEKSFEGCLELRPSHPDMQEARSELNAFQNTIGNGETAQDQNGMVHIMLFLNLKVDGTPDRTAQLADGQVEVSASVGQWVIRGFGSTQEWIACHSGSQPPAPLVQQLLNCPHLFKPNGFENPQRIDLNNIQPNRWFLHILNQQGLKYFIEQIREFQINTTKNSSL